MSSDEDIRSFLAKVGFGHADATAAALEVLYAAGLTRAGKQRMASTKLDAAREALAAALIVTCSAARCIEEAKDSPERTRVPAAQRSDCEICEGSDNQHAVDAMVRRARERGVTKLVVIGGSPSTREQLAALIKGRVELKTVDGTLRRTAQQAGEDMRWAQLVVIWGSTELAHRVSMLYTRSDSKTRVITVARRGIGALAEAVVKTLG